MRKVSLMAMFLAAVLLASGAAWAEGEKCSLGRYATLPITIDNAGGVTVSLKVEDQVQNMLIDMGGVFSMLTDAAAARLNLRPQTLWGTSIKMLGGRTLDHYVVAHSMEIAGARVRDRKFVLVPNDLLPPGDDGILGPDILQVFDVDFDFAGGKVGLFSQDHCEGKVVYWTHDPHAQIPFKLDESRHIKIDLQLDGQEVPAILDTGAYRSLLRLETAEYIIGNEEATLKKNNYHYAFKTLTLQGVIVNNPDIVLVPDDKTKVMGSYRQPKLLLSMGILRQLHLFIAYKEHNIYVTAASAH
jgi:predicted aspartyl protease